MIDNEILARWQGKCYHVSDWGQTDCKYCGRTNDPRYFDFDSINPDYPNDPAACMSLLDTLVEKNYCPLLALNGTTHLWQCAIDRFYTHRGIELHEPFIDDEDLGRTTINQAIIAACLVVARRELEVARKEQGDE